MPKYSTHLSSPLTVIPMGAKDGYPATHALDRDRNKPQNIDGSLIPGIHPARPMRRKPTPPRQRKRNRARAWAKDFR